MEERIYRSPESDLENVKPERRGWKILRGVLYSIFSIFIYFSLGSVITQFSVTFKSFGADLPLLTKLVVDLVPSYRWIGYLSIIIFAAFVASQIFVKVRSTTHKTVKYNFFIALVILVICIMSMYLPIFTIGSVV